MYDVFIMQRTLLPGYRLVIDPVKIGQINAASAQKALSQAHEDHKTKFLHLAVQEDRNVVARSLQS